MKLVYFKTDTSGPVQLSLGSDFSLLGRNFGLNPASILLNGIGISKTGLESAYTWQEIEKSFKECGDLLERKMILLQPLLRLQFLTSDHNRIIFRSCSVYRSRWPSLLVPAPCLWELLFAQAVLEVNAMRPMLAPTSAPMYAPEMAPMAPPAYAPASSVMVPGPSPMQSSAARNVASSVGVLLVGLAAFVLY